MPEELSAGLSFSPDPGERTSRHYQDLVMGSLVRYGSQPSGELPVCRTERQYRTEVVYQPYDDVHVRFQLIPVFYVTVHVQYRCQIEQDYGRMKILKNAVGPEGTEQFQSLLILIDAV